MATYETDRRILELAQTQYGVVTYAQLRRAGISKRIIVGRLGAGVLLPLEHETYGVAGFPPTWRRQYKAAELSVDGAAIKGLAAARLHRFDGARVVRPELVVPYTRSVRNKLATVSRSALADIAVVDGIRATSVAQTLFDLRYRVDLRQVERWVDDALLTGKTSPEHLERRTRAYDHSRVRAIGVWRTLIGERLDTAWAPPESELEAMLWRAYDAVPGRPPARRQMPAWWTIDARQRFDIVVPDWRLILEADGRRWHARVADFDADRWRDSVALAHGYAVQRFTWLHLTQQWHEVVQLIESAGASRIAA